MKETTAKPVSKSKVTAVEKDSKKISKAKVTKKGK